MEPDQLVIEVRRLLEEAGISDGLQVVRAHDDAVVRARADISYRTLRALKDAGFDGLAFVTAVDNPDQITVVYLLIHYGWRNEAFVEVRLDRDDAKLRSVADIWPAADWHERETYDLLGVAFEGHPDLRRILTWEGFEGHPLRKDYSDPSVERRPDYI